MVFDDCGYTGSNSDNSTEREDVGRMESLACARMERLQLHKFVRSSSLDLEFFFLVRRRFYWHYDQIVFNRSTAITLDNLLLASDRNKFTRDRNLCGI